MTAKHVEETASQSGPHGVDIYVGARVRSSRKSQGMSQGDLAAAVGLTFQQIQKYERGSNRISASKLHAIASILGVPIAWFFEGYDETAADGFSESASELQVNAFLSTAEGIELARVFPGISSLRQRRSILDLVRSLSSEGEP